MTKTHWGNYSWMGTEMDALYTIADAELASRQDIHHIWDDLARRHKVFAATFARRITPAIQQIARRDSIHLSNCVDLMRGPCYAIALRIAEDWKRSA